MNLIDHTIENHKIFMETLRIDPKTYWCYVKHIGKVEGIGKVFNTIIFNLLWYGRSFGQRIPYERIEELEKHFPEAFKKTREEIDRILRFW